MRLFIAIEMPKEVITLVRELQIYFKELAIVEARYTNPDDVHLTLKFLGDVGDEQVSELCDRLKAVQFPSQQAYSGQLGLFSSHERSKILFMHIVCPALIELVLALDLLLPEFPEEKRAFINHATLARIKSVLDEQRLIRVVEIYQVPRLDFEINQFMLKRSELTAQGPVYTDVARFALK